MNGADLLQADVLADLVAASVQQQERKETAHSPVAVQELVRTQKIAGK